ncbi:TPA: WxcM-like domain-containing protein, partial [Campylobacter jejuni]|nr:WxcM-like domain-containing protein [Campylobacter jejuni]
KDCILLVLTNTYYDEKEYIYDYKYFCELKNNIVWRGGVCYKNHALKVA